MYKNTIDYIRSLYGGADFVPLHAPNFHGNEKKYLNECVDSTFVSSVGAFVDRFEVMLAEFTGAAKAVVCVNGTNALHMALHLVGVSQDDEVITQSLTFIATANAIAYCGAHPVFLDIDKDTLGLSPKAVTRWLEANAELRDGVAVNKTTGRVIRACVPMHTFGHPMRIVELKAVCDTWHIELVEDAAESLGSYYQGAHTGTFGKVGVVSFNGNKTITTGGGGALLFNDVNLAARAKHLTTQAKVPHRWEFVHDEIGYNYRMPNINAALGCAQLEQLPGFLENKRATALNYKRFFAESNLVFVDEPSEAKSNFWLNAVLLPNRDEQQRFLQETNDAGIMTRPVWQLMSRLPMFAGAQKDDLTNTMWVEERLVNIPSSVRL